MQPGNAPVPDSQRENVPFWFDPLCPWAWITSRWILEVEQVRPVHADWRIMSLAYLNLIQREGKGLSEDYRDLMVRAWGPVRVCAAAAEHHGHGILGPLYTALGTRLHNHRRRDDPAVIPEALAEAGLPGSLAAAVASTEFDQLIKDSHDGRSTRSAWTSGHRFSGSPGTALFGPVVTPAPRGEAAGQLWDGLVLIARTEGFFELKRSRDRKPSFG